MKKPTTANRAKTTRAAVSHTRSSVTMEAPYVAVTGVTGSLLNLAMIIAEIMEWTDRRE
jgi:hypothetical protein